MGLMHFIECSCTFCLVLIAIQKEKSVGIYFEVDGRCNAVELEYVFIKLRKLINLLECKPIINYLSKLRRKIWIIYWKLPTS